MTNIKQHKTRNSVSYRNENTKQNSPPTFNSSYRRTRNAGIDMFLLKNSVFQHSSLGPRTREFKTKLSRSLKDMSLPLKLRSTKTETRKVWFQRAVTSFQHQHVHNWSSSASTGKYTSEDSLKPSDANHISAPIQKTNTAPSDSPVPRCFQIHNHLHFNKVECTVCENPSNSTLTYPARKRMKFKCRERGTKTRGNVFKPGHSELERDSWDWNQHEFAARDNWTQAFAVRIRFVEFPELRERGILESTAACSPSYGIHVSRLPSHASPSHGFTSTPFLRWLKSKQPAVRIKIKPKTRLLRR